MDRWLFILTRLAGALTPLCSVLWLQKNDLDDAATTIITAITLAAALMAIVSRGQHTTAIFDRRCGHLASSSNILVASLIPAAALQYVGYVASFAVWMGAVGLYLTLVSEIYYRAVREDVRANVTFLKIPIIVGATLAPLTPYFMNIVGVIGFLTYLTAHRKCKSELMLCSNNKTNTPVWLNSIANYGISNADLVIALNILSPPQVVGYFILKRCFMAIEPLFVSMTASLNRELRDASGPSTALVAINRHIKNMLAIASIWVLVGVISVLFIPDYLASLLAIPRDLINISYGFLCAIFAIACSSGLGYAFVYFKRHNENLLINIKCLLSILLSMGTLSYIWPDSPVENIVIALVIGLSIKSVLSLSLVRLALNSQPVV